MSLPEFGVDANGLPTIIGVEQKKLTQSQADYTNLAKAADLVTGPAGVKLRLAAQNLVKDDPTTSIGVIAGFAKAGGVPKTPLVEALMKIDKQTKRQRKVDAKKETQRKSTEDFNKSPQGKLWSGLKFAVRGIATVGWTPIEVLNASFRNSMEEDASLFARFSGVLNTILNTPEQTTAGQIGISLGRKEKIELGNGFFASEEVGVGFNAREAAMKVAKRSFVINGETYYRPYSLIDPIASVLTTGGPGSKGDPDGNISRFIVMLGEIGVSLKLDPFLIYGKLSKQAKITRKAAEGATGSKAVRLLAEATNLENDLAALVKKTERSLNAVHKSSAPGKKAKTATYKKNLAAQMKMQDSLGNIKVDYDGIAAFVSGTGGEHIIDALVNIDDWQTIVKISKGKVPAKVAYAMASATSREEILRVMAPFIANGDVLQGALQLGNTTTRALSRIVKGTTPGVATSLKAGAGSALKRMPYTEEIFKIGNGISRKYNAYVPDAGGTLVHVDNTDKLLEVVNNVAAKLKLDINVTKGILDDIVKSADGSGAGFTASATLFTKIFEQVIAAGNYTPEQIKQIKKLTTVFETERKNTALFWATQHAKNVDIDFVVAGMQPFKIHSSHLDSELLNSFVYIPSGEEVSQFINQMSTFKSTLGIVDKGLTEMTGFWKKSVLIRPAYIVRNIAEEQIRVTLSGHVSFFNHPLAAAAMALGKDDGPGWRKLVNEFNSVRNDAYGISFTSANRAKELAQERMAADLIDGYMEYMGNTLFTSIDYNVMNKISKATGFKEVTFGNEKWWDGFASQLRILHNSEFVRQVLKTGSSEKARLKTVDYFLKGKGRKNLDRFINLKDAETKAALSTRSGLMAFLFNGVNKDGELVSVLARIEELAGAGGKSSNTIKKLLLDGKINLGKTQLVVPTGREVAMNSIQHAREVAKGRKGLEDANAIFAQELKKTFDGTGDWNNIRMTLREDTVLTNTSRNSLFQKLPDWFFDKAGRFEKISTMGPEWQQSYWDAVRNVVGAADAEAVAKLNVAAKKSLSRIRNPITKETVGLKHTVWKQLEKADGTGNMTINEIHTYAEKLANKQTAALFYNAGKRRLLFHQLRIVMPFAQAWEDTIRSWSKLALDNPMEVYKINKAIDWLSSSSSSALYELTDARDYYDPNQGFFFSDPNSGERKFFMPFAGAGINLVTNLATGGRVDFEGPFAMTATPQSFNFALGNGSIMPGFGPGVAITTAILDSLDYGPFKNPMKYLPAAVEEEIYKIMYPYGTPDLRNNGIIESGLLSSNWTRIVGAVGGKEEAYASALPAIMTYLANSGDYDSDVPEDQVRLVTDSNRFARWFTLWRGVTGAFMPIPFSLRPEALAKSKDGDTVLATSLFADFKIMEEESNLDRNAAYGKFLDTYGPEQIYAIIRTSTNFEPTNLPTYNLIKNNPEVMNKYPDVYGLFYPNGELSQVLYKYQQQRGAFSKLSAEQIMQRATQIKYYAAVDRLRTRSVAEGWDIAKFKAASSSLTKVFKQSDLSWDITIGKKDKGLRQLRAAAADESLNSSEAIAGLRQYLPLYDKALELAGEGGFMTIKKCCLRTH
jgi:hypothetical protein